MTEIRDDENAQEFKKQRGKQSDKLSSDLQTSVIIHGIKNCHSLFRSGCLKGKSHKQNGSDYFLNQITLFFNSHAF